MLPSARRLRRGPRVPAAGAAGAAAALANLNVNVNPVGDWTTQAADPGVSFRALGNRVSKHRAAQGDREAVEPGLPVYV